MQKVMLATTRFFRRIFPALIAMLLLFAFQNQAFAAEGNGSARGGNGNLMVRHQRMELR